MALTPPPTRPLRDTLKHVWGGIIQRHSSTRYQVKKAAYPYVPYGKRGYSNWNFAEENCWNFTKCFEFTGYLLDKEETGPAGGIHPVRQRTDAVPKLSQAFGTSCAKVRGNDSLFWPSYTVIVWHRYESMLIGGRGSLIEYWEQHRLPREV